MGNKTSLRSEVESLIRMHGDRRESLMPILQDVNRSHSYVPEEAMELISEALDIPRSDIYGVVTFYSYFSIKPRGKYVIRMCRTMVCNMNPDYQGIVMALTDDLGISFGETTRDNLFTLEQTNCIGMCDQGPAMLVNDDVHVRLTPESVRKILAFYRDTARAENAAMKSA